MSLLLLVDLDGVVYRGLDPVPGVAAVLADRAARGDDVVYVTNNSMHYRADYQKYMCYERAMSPDARPSHPAVAIDVTPLLGARSGIGNAVAEIVAALGDLEAAPTLVPYQRVRDYSAPTRRPTRASFRGPRVFCSRRGARTDVPRVDGQLRPRRVPTRRTTSRRRAACRRS